MWDCMHRYLQCTGALLDTAHILTAAHCVWNIEATSAADRTYVSTLNFYPGENGGTLSSNSLGVYTWHSVKVLSEFTDQSVSPSPSISCSGIAMAGAASAHAAASLKCRPLGPVI